MFCLYLIYLETLNISNSYRKCNMNATKDLMRGGKGHQMKVFFQFVLTSSNVYLKVNEESNF